MRTRDWPEKKGENMKKKKCECKGKQIWGGEMCSSDHVKETHEDIIYVRTHHKSVFFFETKRKP